MLITNINTHIMSHKKSIEVHILYMYIPDICHIILYMTDEIYIKIILYMYIVIYLLNVHNYKMYYKMFYKNLEDESQFKKCQSTLIKM